MFTSASPLASIASELKFDFEQGSIEFYDKRVALLHLSLFGRIIGSLAKQAGPAQAGKILAEIGRAEGAKYYQDPLPVSSGAGTFGLHNILYLHAIAGMSSPEIVSFSSRPEKAFYCELVLNNSFEAAAFAKFSGKSDYPVCWIQVGHLGELISKAFGRDVVFQETECRAMGADVCRVIGREASAARQQNMSISRAPKHAAGSALLSSSVQAPTVIGSSAHMMMLLQNARKAAATNATVLLSGETGVGKERFAETIHFFSKRSKMPFVAVNCGALPRDLVESEMFGVAKGAYTGAVGARPGRFERADGGTLFLDEVGTLPLDAQVKLLRVLEDGKLERVGDSQTRHVKVRVIAATNLDLRAQVRAGHFRADLYHRLAVFPIHIPPLRERREDIPALIAYLLSRATEALEKQVAGITDAAISYLVDQPLEGNVRELQHRLERAIILADEDEEIDVCHVRALESECEITPQHFSNDHSGPSCDVADISSRVSDDVMNSLQSLGSLKELERVAVEVAMAHARGNRTRAAELLGFTRSQLAYRLR